MEIRYGQQNDFIWLQGNDTHVNAEWVPRCLNYNEYIVATEGENRKGFLRYSLFWGSVPYMDIIKVLEPYRRDGVGTSMLNFWEQKMRTKNAKVLMTSSVVNELEPQTWHKRNGFRECGQLTFGQHEPTPEVFFVKDLV